MYAALWLLGVLLLAVVFLGHADIHAYLVSAMLEGITLQAIMAVLNLANVPVGTLYAGLALYVIWNWKEEVERLNATPIYGSRAVARARAARAARAR